MQTEAPCLHLAVLARADSKTPQVEPFHSTPPILVRKPKTTDTSEIYRNILCVAEHNSSCRCVPADQVSKTVHKGAHNVEVCRLLNRGLLDKIPSLVASMRKNRIDSCWVQGVSILAGFAS